MTECSAREAIKNKENILIKHVVDKTNVKILRIHNF
jgi:hypothetical protein